jgi:hypothetical protein
MQKAATKNRTMNIPDTQVGTFLQNSSQIPTRDIAIKKAMA